VNIKHELEQLVILKLEINAKRTMLKSRINKYKSFEKIRDHTNKRIDELEKEYNYWLNLINELENETYKYILLKRYIENKTVKDVANELDYSKKLIYRKQSRAIAELEIKHLKQYKNTGTNIQNTM